MARVAASHDNGFLALTVLSGADVLGGVAE